MPAKPETFFIRGTVLVGDVATFAQTTIDLGSYVNVGDKKAVIMRIHNIEGEWAQGTAGALPNAYPQMDPNAAGGAVWQLSTQDQTGLIPLTDRSCIAKGQLWARNDDGSSNPPASAYSDSHLPQSYSSGYLVATDNIYLGGFGETSWADTTKLTFNMQMEVSLEPVSQSNAVSLALSQQN